MHPLVRLARQTIETYVKTGRVIDPSSLSEVQDTAKPGVFVSIHYITGELRGCVGTFHTTERFLVEQVIRSAVSACSHDPRFPPVQPSELPLLSVKVDILSPFESIDSPDDLDIKYYGLMVESGRKRGLLLPDIPGIANVEQQIEIAKMKAGIRLDEPIKMYRFTVERYTEEDVE
jgi:AmmeMemoRadiSam system protein A